ncbi:unnamed protein product [Brugia pahangi]|uniref:Uncharacterized protein n=1 Tax=Brugia pahangi TaxID=6280 RepID=A0A158PRJ4_BRUPA|nr:unnamed protein product [Brugia pahangi]
MNHRTYNNFTSNTFTPKRSTSYGSGTKLNDIGGVSSSLRRYDNDYNSVYERRTSYTPSHYSTSGYASSSYGTLLRNNRSQTPSYIGRERNYALNREYKSTSRFSTDREHSQSDDNVKQRLEKFYNRYAKDHEISNNHLINDSKFCNENKNEITIAANDDEGDEKFSANENFELKDILRGIAKLNEKDVSEDNKLKKAVCSNENEIISMENASNSIQILKENANQIDSSSIIANQNDAEISTVPINNENFVIQSNETELKCDNDVTEIVKLPLFNGLGKLN